MAVILSVAQIRSAERALFERTPERDVMLRAATGLATTCARLLQADGGTVYGAHVTLLVGGGNNGGDALFAGAQLARRGAQVVAVTATEVVHQDGLATFRFAGGRVGEADQAEEFIAESDLVVDGLVGIGAKGALRGNAAMLAIQANECPGLVVAVDVPSGVDADTGQMLGEAVCADVTVTFGAMKPGLLLPPGSHNVGLLEVVDIGLDVSQLHNTPHVPELVDIDRVRGLLPVPTPSDHKYSLGVTGVAAGSARYPGAAILSVGGALRAKSGLVRYCGTAAEAVISQWPAAIVAQSLPSEAGNADAWAVGPGIGTDDDGRKLVEDVLALPVPVVLDADALTLVAQHPELLKEREQETVLTPHEGEFRRLMPDDSTDRIGSVVTLAERTGCTVLLKGSATIIGSPSGHVSISTSGTPFLATAGTGDVLSGIIASYLAAGLPASDAASLGAFIHGFAGRIASDGAPCTAFDVVEAIPAAIHAVDSA